MRPNDKKHYIECIKRRFSQSSHINCEICSECGGNCCKRGGCGLMTCDVPELSVRGIRKMLDTGKYSITFFAANMDGEIIPVPIMNAREIGSERVDYSIIRKPCAQQNEEGCSFSDDERPTLGLLYIPKTNRDCKLLVSEMELLGDWYPHKEIMEEVILEETGKSSKELFYKGCIEAAMEIRSKLDVKKELTESEMCALEVLYATGVILIITE